MISFRTRAAVVVAAGAVVVACATGGGSARTGGPAPVDLSALEAQRAQQPNDPALNLRLARAYYAADRFADARRALGVVLTQQPGNNTARAYLGFTYEGLEQFDSARTVYTGLLAAKPRGEVARLMSGRLALLSRHELHVRARQAIARETELSRTPPDPNTIAVMPFRYTGSDSSLRPLERGLASLVVTDLSRVSRLKLVERERLQALLDELKLAGSGRVDTATSARSGRLIGAGQVVQGQFQEVPTANFRIDAATVRASDAQVAATGSGQDQLRALFDIEKSVVFQLLRKMNVPITPAESVAISERPTRDLQAFLLYSRGLEARDRGNYEAASLNFRAASQRDPSFSQASQQAQSSSDAATASTTSETNVAAVVGGGSEAPAGGGAGGTTQTLASAINSAVPTGAGLVTPTNPVDVTKPPTDPGRICEAANCEGPTRPTLIGTLIIIIQRP
jgi:TolB-like protein